MNWRIIGLITSTMTFLNTLVSIINTENNRLTTYIDQKRLSQSSFDVNDFSTFPISLNNKKLQKFRVRLMKTTQDLIALTLGPVEILRWQAWNVSVFPFVPFFVTGSFLSATFSTELLHRALPID